MFSYSLIVPQAQLVEQKTENSNVSIRIVYEFSNSILNLHDATGSYNEAVSQKSCSKQHTLSKTFSFSGQGG